MESITNITLVFLPPHAVPPAELLEQNIQFNMKASMLLFC